MNKLNESFNEYINELKKLPIVEKRNELIKEMFALGGNYQALLFSIFKAEQLKFGEVYRFLVNFDQLLM